MRDEATCRGCRRLLNGRNYCYGGRAYIPRADGSNGAEAKVNYYGGFVCSRDCDVRASLELEQSMPGHGYSQRQPGREAMARINSNWPDD